MQHKRLQTVPQMRRRDHIDCFQEVPSDPKHIFERGAPKTVATDKNGIINIKTAALLHLESELVTGLIPQLL